MRERLRLEALRAKPLFAKLSNGVLIGGMLAAVVIISSTLAVVALLETGALRGEVTRIQTIHQGPPGKDGKDSVVPGPPGPSGVPGKDSTVPGPPGRNGTNGTNGKNGVTTVICELPTGKRC